MARRRCAHVHVAHHGPTAFVQACEDLRRGLFSASEPDTWADAAVLAGRLGAEGAAGWGLRLVPGGEELALRLGLPRCPVPPSTSTPPRHRPHVTAGFEEIASAASWGAAARVLRRSCSRRHTSCARTAAVRTAGASRSPGCAVPGCLLGSACRHPRLPARDDGAAAARPEGAALVALGCVGANVYLLRVSSGSVAIAYFQAVRVALIFVLTWRSPASAPCSRAAGHDVVGVVLPADRRPFGSRAATARQMRRWLGAGSAGIHADVKPSTEPGSWRRTTLLEGRGAGPRGLAAVRGDMPVLAGGS